MLQRSITVRTQFEGIHCWPEAPSEVSYLREPHRHIFHIRANVDVSHDDRDVEFIMLKHRIDDWLKCRFDQQYKGNVWLMGRMSCEQVAERIILVMQEYVGMERVITVFVSEDGENEAMAQYCPDEDEDEDGRPETLSLQDYQNQAYIAIQEHENKKEEVMHWAIGLGEEAGETLSVIKHKYYGGRYSVDNLIDELGDTLWHIAVLCTANNIQLEDVARYNLAKLSHRYPEGTFDGVRSIHRHEVDKSFKNTDEYAKIMSDVTETSTDWKQDVEK